MTPHADQDGVKYCIAVVGDQYGTAILHVWGDWSIGLLDEISFDGYMSTTRVNLISKGRYLTLKNVLFYLHSDD